MSDTATIESTRPVRPWAAILVAVAVLLLGVGLSIAAAVNSRQAAQRLERVRFTQQATALVVTVENSIASAIEKVRSQGDYVRGRENLTAAKFATFARPAIERLPQIHSMTWVEVVTDAQRPMWEAQLALEIGDSQGIRQPGPGSTGIVPAPPAPLYYAVRYAETVERSGRPHGFNAAASSERRAAIERARDTGEPIVTPVVPLLSTPEPLPSFVLYVPVYRGEPPPTTVEDRRERLMGFATSGFRVGRLLQATLRESTGQAVNLHFFDVTDGEPKGIMSWPTDDPYAAPDADLLQRVDRGELASQQDFSFAGRTWRVIATPGPEYLAEDTDRAAAVLAAGLCFTALTTLLLLLAFRRNNHLRTLAQARALHAARLQREIADREAAQQALAKANDELRQVNAEMEQFVSAVSHDLKNPLVAIDWTVSALRSAVDKGQVEQTRQGLETMAKAAASMRRIIDDLIAHARAGWAGFKPEKVELATLIRRVLDERAEEIARRGVATEVVGELPAVTADRGRLTAALDNLVTNALKYGCTHPKPKLRVGCDHHNGHVRLFVEDNGKGIPPDQRERVFQIFHRLSRDSDGTGIGLAIVDRVAKSHQGKAWVEEATEGGARFCVAFPQ